MHEKHEFLTVGYDMRVDPRTISMPPLRYELCTEKTAIFTVDSSVWPSIFRIDPRTASAIDSHRTIQDLWSNRDSMRDCLIESRQLTGNILEVCFSLYAETGKDWDITWSSIAETINIHPGAALDCVGWDLMGHDIADRFLLSSLANYFGPFHEKHSYLSSIYCPRINDFHLFDTVDDAIEYRSNSSPLASDHSPFFIFSVYTRSYL